MSRMCQLTWLFPSPATYHRICRSHGRQDPSVNLVKLASVISQSRFDVELKVEAYCDGAPLMQSSCRLLPVLSVATLLPPRPCKSVQEPHFINTEPCCDDCYGQPWLDICHCTPILGVSRSFFQWSKHRRSPFRPTSLTSLFTVC